MAQITLKGQPIETVGDLPAIGSTLPDFELTELDLEEVRAGDFRGKSLILNIFPSVDTGTCAMSVRKFNQDAASLEGTVVLCVSADLPFAMKRFCGAEGIDNVEMASTFRSNFGSTYGVEMKTGPMRGMLSRAVLVADGNGSITYSEQVGEVGDEPDYHAALDAIKALADA